jgi:hypothetical protein
MISARQTKNIIEYMFGTSSGFIAPTAIFTASPSAYNSASIPTGTFLNGTITLNDALLATTAWAITYGATTLATGTGTSVAHSLVAIPATIGSYTYNLTVSYVDDNNANVSIVIPTVVSVTAVALYGQLVSGSDTSSLATLNLAISASTLSSTSKTLLINPLAITLVETPNGKVIFVIPDSYGAVTSIEESSVDILNQFNVTVDTANSRTIYTSILDLTPSTITYKIVF